LSAYDKVAERSGGRCEAMVWVMRSDDDGVWTRCGKDRAQIHHMLRRSHGGELLDAVGETYHLIALCPDHHGKVHAGILYDGHGLLIEGNVYPGPVYVGPDAYLLEHYGEESHEARRSDEGRQGSLVHHP